MATTYRVTLTSTDGTKLVREMTQDEWDTFVDAHEAREGDYYPVVVRERQRRNGSWMTDAGWDYTAPRQTAAPARHHYVSDGEAIAKMNDAADRKQIRRDYYLRTGR